MTLPVGIVGLGTMGSMAAWQLARRGHAVVGFERFGLGHGHGAFSGETRMFRTAYANGGHWAPALQAARGLWRELEGDGGLPLLDLNGFLSIGRRGQESIERLIAGAGDAAIPVELLDAAETRARFPAIVLEEGEVAVFDPAGGLIKPERAVMTALTLAEAHGAELRRDSTVLAIEPQGGAVALVTSGGRLVCRSVVVTAGAWAGTLLGLPVTPHRVALHWYLARRPEAFAPARFPPHIRYVDGRSVCLFSSQDDTMVKAAIGGSLGPLAEPGGARDAEPWEREPLSAAIARHYPDLWPDPVRSESYADGFTPDRDALVGALPDRPNVIVAAGFSAHGFKIAPLVGAALADLVESGGTARPLGHLRLDRDAVPRATGTAR